jgi:molecular chaperone DnaK
MSKDDIDKAVREAQQFEAEDQKRKEGVDTKNEADSIVFQTEKALKEVGDKVSESDRAAVQADIDALKNALNALPADGSLTDDQIANIKSLREKLMNSSQGVFTKMYEQAQAANAGAQGAGQNMGGQSAPHDDNVVDGDFREV